LKALIFHSFPTLAFEVIDFQTLLVSFLARVIS